MPTSSSDFVTRDKLSQQQYANEDEQVYVF